MTRRSILTALSILGGLAVLVSPVRADEHEITAVEARALACASDEQAENLDRINTQIRRAAEQGRMAVDVFLPGVHHDDDKAREHIRTRLARRGFGVRFGQAGTRLSVFVTWQHERDKP